MFAKLKEHGIDREDHLQIYMKKEEDFLKNFSDWNATNTLGSKQSLRYSLWKR